MTARAVIKMGNPLLRRIAKPVERFGTEELERLIEDLWDTMHVMGGVGIAAPQIAVSQRVVVFGMDQHPRDLDVEPIPRTVLINPVIKILDEALEDGWEGCLSVPGMRGLVPRYTRIRYAGVDAGGHAVEREVHGYHARVVQHECDHLDGVLYPMRMRSLDRFGYADEIASTLLEEIEQQAE